MTVQLLYGKCTNKVQQNRKVRVKGWTILKVIIEPVLTNFRSDQSLILLRGAGAHTTNTPRVMFTVSSASFSSVAATRTRQMALRSRYSPQCQFIYQSTPRG